MNLWAKRTGQLLLIAVLFLMSCEDDTFLLGFQNEVKKFDVKFREFSIGNGSIVSVDSTTTDNNTSFKRILIGEDVDPVVGTTRVEAFTQFFGDGVKLAAKADHTYVYDSIVLSLELDSYSHGLTGNALGKYNVYRVTENLTYSKDETYTMPGTGKEVLVKVPTNYFTNSTAQYSADVLGQTRFQELFFFNKKERRINTTVTTTKLSNNTDTLVACARLSDAFGQELFAVALENANDGFSNSNNFKEVFKGLALIPEEGNAILGFNPSSKFTRVRLYYHSELVGAVKDTLTKDFSFSGVSFHSINSNRNAGFPSADQPYVGVDQGNQRIVQNGEVMITKIDLNDFYTQFADVVNDENIIINAAEIVIEGVTPSEEYAPLPVLELRLMNDENDSYLNYRMITKTKRDSLAKFYVFSDGRNYFVNSDFFQSQTPLAAGLSYNKTKNNYSGSVTFLLQNLFGNRNSSYRFRYLAIYPGTSRTGSTTAPPLGKTLNRSLFLKENIKLRVYYTQANKSNL